MQAALCTAPAVEPAAAACCYFLLLLLLLAVAAAAGSHDCSLLLLPGTFVKACYHCRCVMSSYCCCCYLCPHYCGHAGPEPDPIPGTKAPR